KNRDTLVNSKPARRIRKGPFLSVKKPEAIFPIMFENENIPTARPVTNGVAPSEPASGVMMGNCENKSKKEKKIMIYTKIRIKYKHLNMIIKFYSLVFPIIRQEVRLLKSILNDSN